LSLGGCHENERESEFRDTRVRPVGADGGASPKTTAAEGMEKSLVPERLIAATRNLYGIDLTNPSIRTDSISDTKSLYVVQVAPSLDEY
jgi:hypothetical protein